MFGEASDQGHRWESVREFTNDLDTKKHMFGVHELVRLSIHIFEGAMLDQQMKDFIAMAVTRHGVCADTASRICL